MQCKIFTSCVYSKVWARLGQSGHIILQKLTQTKTGRGSWMGVAQVIYRQHATLIRVLTPLTISELSSDTSNYQFIQLKF